MPELFEWRSGGELWCTLHSADAEAVAFLAEQLAERLAGDAPVHDETFDRLFPRAYLDPTEEAAAQEWNAHVRPDLVRGKRAALVGLAELLRSASRVGGSGGLVTTRLGNEDAESWLSALNDLRLALGTRLGVSEESDPSTVDPDDPEAPWWSVYTFLTWCEGSLVEVLLDDAEDGGAAVDDG